MFKNFTQLADYVKKNGIRFINFKVTDLAGRWHNLSILADRFSEDLLKKGLGFDGSSYGFLTVEKSDMVFLPDITSAFADPVSEMPSISMIGDVYKLDAMSHERFEDDPRYVAQKAEKYLLKTGISDRCLFGQEFEFYIIDNIEYRIEANHIEAHLDSEQAHWNAHNSMYDGEGTNPGYKVLVNKG